MSSYVEATPSTSTSESQPARPDKRGAGGDEVEGRQKRRRANSVPAPSLPAPDSSLIPRLPELVFTQDTGLGAGHRILVDLGYATLAMDIPVNVMEPLSEEEVLFVPAHAAEIPIDPALFGMAVTQTPPIADGTPTQPAAPVLAPDLRICSKRCSGGARPLAQFTRSRYPHGALEPKAQCNECNRKYVRRVSVADFQALYLAPDAEIHEQWMVQERQRRRELQLANAQALLGPPVAATEGDGAALEAPLPEGAAPAEQNQAE